MASRQNSAYVSQVLRLEPASAGLVLDVVYRGLPPVDLAPRFVRFGEGLWLSADGLQAEPATRVVRAVRGVLWFGCRPVRVLVELVEWSSEACEAAIRPLSYSWPVWTDRYARCAAGHLERLVDSLRVEQYEVADAFDVTAGQLNGDASAEGVADNESRLVDSHSGHE